MKINPPKKSDPPIERKRQFSFARLFILAAFVLGAFLVGVFIEPIYYAYREAVDNISAEFRLYEANELETVFLDIPYDSLYTIQEKRDQALDTGILITDDEDFVPAALHLSGGEIIQIKLRLKGDWTDHLESDKWSFRIHIQDEAAIFGMQRFSLQAPETRTFIYEWAYHQHLIREGVLTTRYHFVNVILNGEHKGIYALEESFSPELFEAQGRREGILFKFNEGVIWENTAEFYQGDFDEFSAAEQIGFFIDQSSLSSLEISPFRENRILANEILLTEYQTARDQLYSFIQGSLSAEEALDTELWGKFFAISDLWAAGHATASRNLRFYYNPITGLIEPVSFDGLAMSEPLQAAYPFTDFPFEQFFDHPEVQKSYIQTLERITKDSYLADLRDELEEDVDVFYRLLQKEYRHKGLTPTLSLPWENLEFRAAVFSKNLNPVQIVRGGYQFVQSGEQDFLEIDLINLLRVPVQIYSVAFDGVTYPADSEWCSNGLCLNDESGISSSIVLKAGETNRFEPISLLIPIPPLYNPEPPQQFVDLEIKIYGGENTFSTSIATTKFPQELSSTPRPQVNLEEALSFHPYLSQVNESLLMVRQGDWEVGGDLVIPKGFDLVVPSGTTLRFEEGSILLVYGGFSLQGEEEAPITLTSQGDNWGGIVIMDAESSSTWQNAIVENTLGVERDGWVLTGGITFYRSPVDLEEVIIRNSLAEDALNVVHADYAMEEVLIINTASDGFDADFTSGVIIDCNFKEIAGDGVDVSNSDLEIKNTHFENISDKAISVGEQSAVEVRNVQIFDVGIGIASKDLSKVNVFNSTITRASTAGLAAYIKKPQFGPGSISAENVLVNETEKITMSQTESSIILNGVRADTEDFNVEELYALGILGN